MSNKGNFPWGNNKKDWRPPESKESKPKTEKPKTGK